ncbi:ketopantoate reductase family protein [Candidatus Formimonas warabiya]|uniref:2-dehydropantoate 2-reductase n=1 Tax=Formimonas warabiya TaxID=1761012 RepID=A0A3G1KV27_FORW1|nr:2-dehydropantoate 2-reductase [Candidatus Formimonas warabiya]ATW26294.1 hypothetical protein DCMF_17370 [Candidatus Formimonas warabiya]
MKTIVVGAGAMGSLVGALLAESGNDVILYDIAKEQVDAINEHGLVIEQGDGRRTVKMKATTDLNRLGTADLLVVLVKSYDTGAAILGVKSCIDAHTKVLTLQNGEGNIDAITKVVPPRQVLAGVTSHGAMLLRPGVIRHNGGARTFIGPVDKGDDSWAKEIAQLLNGAGMDTRVFLDITGTIWTKLIANAAINPLTAITGLCNGALLEDENLLKLMESILEEGKAVAEAQGIKLFRDDMFEYTKSVCAATRENKSSMLMDVVKGRRTEIDAINGMVAMRGQRYQVPTPVNTCMTRLVRSLEKGKR